VTNSQYRHIYLLIEGLLTPPLRQIFCTETPTRSVSKPAGRQTVCDADARTLWPITRRGASAAVKNDGSTRGEVKRHLVPFAYPGSHKVFSRCSRHEAAQDEVGGERRRLLDEIEVVLKQQGVNEWSERQMY
jgi:hypothetical protein